MFSDITTLSTSLSIAGMQYYLDFMLMFTGQPVSWYVVQQ